MQSREKKEKRQTDGHTYLVTKLVNGVGPQAHISKLDFSVCWGNDAFIRSRVILPVLPDQPLSASDRI